MTSSFSFIHAADLHLGSPFAGLALKDEDIARRFATAGRRAFIDLVDAAIEAKVAFMVIAGDIYDGDWPDATIGLFFAQQLARLDRAGIMVAYVRGNHDAESIVTKAIQLPPAVLTFSSRKAETHKLADLRVALHGRSFPERTVPDDFAASYPEPLPGWFNLGILHTSCAGSPGHATYAPCTPAELAARGYDYWALGHVHDYAKLWAEPPVVFPGNLQGRNIRETGPKGAVLVEVSDGRVAAMRRLIVDHARWAHAVVDVGGLDSEPEVLAAIEAALRPHVAEAEGRLLAARVSLGGASPLHDRLKGERERFGAEVQAAAQRLHEDVWLEKLRMDALLPEAAGTPPSALDPSALLAGLDGEDDFRARAQAIIAAIEGRMPGGLRPDGEPALGDDLDSLLDEARAAVMARMAAGEA